MVTELTEFVHLNHGWNADPNAVDPCVEDDGNDLVLGFALNSFGFTAFVKGDRGYIRFHDCSRFRFSSVNDEGWHRGQCRFSALAPKWGEFYEVTGDFKDTANDIVWTFHATASADPRNFLFYFKDNTFECSARDWSFDQADRNALKGFSVE
jgi:hypothetical protein